MICQKMFCFVRHFWNYKLVWNFSSPYSQHPSHPRRFFFIDFPAINISLNRFLMFPRLIIARLQKYFFCALLHPITPSISSFRFAVVTIQEKIIAAKWVKIMKLWWQFFYVFFFITADINRACHSILAHFGNQFHRTSSSERSCHFDKKSERFNTGKSFSLMKKLCSVELWEMKKKSHKSLVWPSRITRKFINSARIFSPAIYFSVFLCWRN